MHDDSLWGEEFLATYLQLADEASHDNLIMNTTGMLVLLGQAQRDLVIPLGRGYLDGRIHGLVIQRSGTGKDPAMNFMKSIAKKAGFEMKIRSQMSTAGLVGTVSKEGEIYGDAYYSDIISYKEASTLFKTAESSHSADLINTMNQILDVDGEVSKRLAHGEISYKTKMSFFGTTYPPREGLRYISEGFIPRMLVAYQDIGDDFYDEVCEWIISSVGLVYNADVKSIEQLAATLKIIREKVSDINYSFTDARETYRSIAKNLKRRALDYPLHIQKMATPFTNRNIIATIKLSTCMAALDNLSTNVNEDHVKIAGNYMDIIWKGILDFMERHSKTTQDKKMRDIEWAVRDLCDIRESNKITLRSLMRYTRLKKAEVESRLRAMEEMGIVKFHDNIRTKGRRSSIVEWLGDKSAHVEDAVYEEEIDDSGDVVDDDCPGGLLGHGTTR